MSINQPVPPSQPVPQAPQGYWINQPTVVPRRTPHGIHLVLTFFTLGFWLPVWIVHALLNSGKTDLKSVPVWVPTPSVPWAPPQAPGA